MNTKRCSICNTPASLSFLLKDGIICIPCAVRSFFKGKLPYSTSTLEANQLLCRQNMYNSNTVNNNSYNNNLSYSSPLENHICSEKDLEVCDSNVTGVMKIQNGINPQSLIKNMRIGDKIVLVADPNNKYDDRAVRVCNFQGVQIGWLPKGSYEQLEVFEHLIHGEPVFASIKKIYEMDYYPGNYGLVIDISYYDNSEYDDDNYEDDDEEIYSEPPIYDELTDDAYRCFLDCGDSPVPDITIQMFDKVCREHNGRCYKTAAKSAKFAVIVNPNYQYNERVMEWHSKGYKVIDVDSFAKFLNIIN